MAKVEKAAPTKDVRLPANPKLQGRLGTLNDPVSSWNPFASDTFNAGGGFTATANGAPYFVPERPEVKISFDRTLNPRSTLKIFVTSSAGAMLLIHRLNENTWKSYPINTDNIIEPDPLESNIYAVYVGTTAPAFVVGVTFTIKVT